MASQRGLEPPIFGSGNRRLVHLATGTTHVRNTSSGTRTHNLTLRRGAPYPLGHGGTKISLRRSKTATGARARNVQKSMPGVGFEPTRTKRPADLKSAPLDPSGIQAMIFLHRRTGDRERTDFGSQEKIKNIPGGT